MNPTQSGSEKAFFGAYGVTYSVGSRTLLDSVSFEMESGEVLALLGPNGAGKSSLLKVIAGIIRIHLGKSNSRAEVSAQIRIRGEDQAKLPQTFRARAVTYVGPELRAEFPMTAQEAVMMGRLCHHPDLFLSFSDADHSRVRAAMERSFCWELRDQDLYTLSGGEKQRVALARAIAQDSKVLLLDEALSKMDLHHQARAGLLLRELAQEGKSIILVSHDVNLAAEWAHTALLLHQGQVRASGPIDQVMTESNFKIIYPDAKFAMAKNPLTDSPQIFFGA